MLCHQSYPGRLNLGIIKERFPTLGHVLEFGSLGALGTGDTLGSLEHEGGYDEGDGGGERRVLSPCREQY